MKENALSHMFPNFDKSDFEILTLMGWSFLMIALLTKLHVAVFNGDRIRDTQSE
ncbi:MAG: hypothetical protein H0U49_05940 [Parachlamydiaceae bacterium]|nr:hypothetical protein [Parachlamydiaceae bacterium]